MSDSPPAPWPTVLQHAAWGELMASERDVLQQQLQPLPAAAMLFVDADGLQPLACLGRLCIRVALAPCGRLQGDLLAAAGAWPWADDSLDVVVLRHLDDLSGTPAGVLAEAARVLTPGGRLLLTSLHPLSTWPAWIAWQTRMAGVAWRVPGPWRARAEIRRAGLSVEACARYGQVLPAARSAHPRGAASDWLGACYLLQARKHRRGGSRIRFEHVRARSGSVHASLSGSTQRQTTGQAA